MYNIVNVIWDLVRGKIEFVSSVEATDRMDICKGCEVRNKRLNICTACGCYLPFKTKLTKAECPMQLW